MANGNVPTGYAPLFLGDLSSRQNALAQNLTERMVEEAQRKRKASAEQQKSDEELLLKAMDFKTVEGLSDQVNTELLDGISNFKNKWVETMYEQGNKLTLEQRLQLKQEQQALEQDHANKKYHVAQIAKIQEELALRPHLYKRSSVDRLRQFIEEGNMGRNTDDILVPHFNASDFIKKRLKFTDADWREEGTPDYSEDKTRYTMPESRAESFDEQMNIIQQTPEWQYEYQDPENKVVMDATVKMLREQYAATRDKSGFTPPHILKQFAEEAAPPEEKALKKKYPGLSPELAFNMEFNNDLATRMLRYDRSALDYVITADPRVMEWEVTNEGNVEWLDDKKRVVHKLEVPQKLNWDNKTHARVALDAVFNTLNLDVMTGKQVGPGRAAHTKETELTPTSDVVPPTSYANLVEALGQEEMNEDDVVNAVGDLFGEEGRGYPSITGKNVLAIKDKPGLNLFHRKTKRFDLKTDKGKQDLLDYVENKFTFVSDYKKRVAANEKRISELPQPEPAPAPQPESEPAPAPQEQTLPAEEQGKRDGLKDRIIEANDDFEAAVLTEAVKKYPNFTELPMEKQDSIRQATRKRLNNIGITEDSFQEAQQGGDDEIAKQNEAAAAAQTEGGRNDAPYIVAGVDIGDYATKKGHEKGVESTYKSIMKQLGQYKESPGNTAMVIDDYMKKHKDVKAAGKSPLKAEWIVKYANEFGLPPALLASTIQVDSSYGTTGKGVRTKNPGNVGNNDAGQLVYFPDWETGVKAAARFLSLPRGKRKESVIYEGNSKIESPSLAKK